jgi:ABC-type nickel/cobalt efflux system permease component RcnA
MRGPLIVLLVLVAALCWWLWPGGGMGQIGQMAAGYQRSFQNEMALTLRATRAGNSGAFWTLLGVCFAYGFFHAVGPGHGKVLIGGYGLGRRVTVLRLGVIALLSSLGQAVTAIVLVQGGLWLFALTREQMVGAAEDVMAPVSYGAVVLIGLWLLGRGVRRLVRRPLAGDHGEHDHDHAHDTCASCGHRHAPSVEEVAGVRSLREALMLIAGVAIRPCTGALFVLVITHGMGIVAAGIAGVFAMAIGTAVVTVAVGTGAVGLRSGLLASVAGGPLAASLLPVVEIAAGALVVIGAGGLLLRAV